ncbi:hypothetical protein CPB85DRAFT_571739 [Mucidula mucida]|nr:hypothetical protein CPB85DRAFT_571739 [Mucidula mucida]
MLTKSFIALGLLAGRAVGDAIHLYLGANCNGEQLGTTSPLLPGTCIDFGQAQSYILEEDDGITYNLYSGDGCSQYVGQTSFSGCMGVGPDATHIVNEGKQAKRSFLPRTIPGRGVPPKASPYMSRRGVPILKRVEGDTYQCPNTSGAYFFVVQQTSAVHGEDGATSFDEEQQIESDWTAAFNRVYNANNGGTTVNSESAGSQGEYLHAQLTVTEGVIHDIHPEDADPLITALNDFRDQQNNPFTFVVGVYTGVVGHPDAGLIGNFRWFAE